jgi:acylphosphatase
MAVRASEPSGLLSSAIMRVARRYLISGRVQGVGFRYFTQDAATRENVHGWVRNLPDGRVEAAAEGDAEALERFERALRHGPPGARVEQLDIEHTVPAGRDSGFNVT